MNKKLLKLYEIRLSQIKYETLDDLVNLARTDEKSLYFVLMYFYLINKELDKDIKFNPILRNSITLFCDSCEGLKYDSAIAVYYSKYINLSEAREQITSIVRELEMFEVRDSINLSK